MYLSVGIEQLKKSIDLLFKTDNSIPNVIADRLKNVSPLTHYFV
ncbi:MAG: hypothetical protein ACI9ES_003397, partial [Oceanospirillaceae bacterium]